MRKKDKEGNYAKPQKLKISDGSQKLQKEFLMCWRYLKESKTYFLAIFTVFLISFFIGFFFPIFLRDMIENFIQELLNKTAGMNAFQLFIFILQNNLITAFIGLLFGLFFGLFPLLLSVFNGYVLGFVANHSVGLFGFISLWRIFPHGIFELPALIISLGLGLKLARFLFAKEGKRKRILIEDLENSLKVFLFIVLPLLVIAAFIETALLFFLA